MILIKHILQAIPTYTLAALCPPKGTIKLIERHFARSCWGAKNDNNRYHWSAWTNIFHTKEEGGVGVSKIEEFSDTLTIKRWRNFRTNNSLWASFLKVKYCHSKHPVMKKWRSRQSHAWKKLMEVKEH